MRAYIKAILGLGLLASASGCAVPEPPKDPTSTAGSKQGKPSPVAKPDPEAALREANCKDVLAPDVRRQIALPTSEASASNLKRFAVLVPDWMECARNGWMDRALYREALLAVRGLLAAWYEQAPRLCAHALVSDTSAQDQGQSVIPAPELAHLYLSIEREIERNDAALGHPASVLDEDLGRRNLVQAMMLTDSLFGVALQKIGGRAPAAPPVVEKLERESSLEDTLARLRPAMNREAQLWADDVFTPDPRADVEHRTARTKGRGIGLQTRLDFVSSRTRDLAGAWGRPVDELRRDLGHGLGGYVAPLADANQRTLAAQKPPARWRWIAHLHDLSGPLPSPTVSMDMPLERIQSEIAFDDFNLAATFAWYAADQQVRELFAFDAAEDGDTTAIKRACRSLLTAAARTEGAEPRLDALSLLLVTADLEDGQKTGTGVAPAPHLPAGTADAAAQADLLRRRRRASRHLAETALCELNRSWLGGPACGVTLDIDSPIPSGGLCALPATSVSPAGSLPTWLTRAYGRVLATLAPNATWTATAKGDPGVSSRTLCEVARLTNGVARGWVPLELEAYEHLTRILVERSIIVPGTDAGTMLAGAMDLAESDAQAACDKLPVCTPASVLAEAERRRKASPDPAIQKNATAYHDHYCEVLQHGAQIAELSTQPTSPARTGQSLLAVGRPSLRPPSEAAFRARGDDMITKAASCSAQAAGPAPKPPAIP